MRTSRPRLTFCFLFSATLAGGACNTYDPSLLEGGAPSDGGGANGGGTNVGASGGGGGDGGSLACESPSECPGMDTECGTRTCEGGTCGVNATPAGTEADTQTERDCLVRECDGDGNIVQVADDGDLPNDDNDCTDDVCVEGVADNVPRGVGETCAGGVCNADADCVECVTGAQCPLSDVCTDRFTCAPASCDDDVQNPGETDVDCGGTMCPGCLFGETCILPTDCVSGECGGLPLTCQESCTDMEENQDETDVDCGGQCDGCLYGQGCSGAGDCESGLCGGTTCTINLLISEVRSRGAASASDEIIELYNAGPQPITLTNDITVSWQPEGSANSTVKFTGAMQTIPSHGHLLIGGSAYAGPPTADATMVTGISDEGSIVLRHGTTVLDAVCFKCTTADLTQHVCEGTPVEKTGCSTASAKSIERRPGNTSGNATDTGNNFADFAEINPAIPQNLASPATP